MIPDGTIGCVRQICKQCGREFTTFFYEGQTAENAKRDYCLCRKGPRHPKSYSERRENETSESN